MLETPKFDTALGAVLTVFLGWIGASIAWAMRVHSQLSVVKSEYAALAKWLERVEDKLDRVIERRR